MPRALLLVGAGASYGAGGIVWYGGELKQPPLGYELFDELVANCSCAPESNESILCWASLDTPLRKMFVDDFEVAMKEVVQRYSRYNQVRLMNCMAGYFQGFRLLPGNSSLYQKVIEVMVSAFPGNDEFALCSLNYESTADQALMRVRRATWTKPSSEPVADDQVRIFRPHGAAQMIPFLNPPFGFLTTPGDQISAGTLWQYYDGQESSAQMRPDHEVSQFMSSWREHGQTPAMAMYMENKPSLTSTLQIGLIRDAYADYIGTADLVVIVGARLALRDEHIFGPILENNSCRVVFVGSEFCGDLRDEGVTYFQSLGPARFTIACTRFDELEITADASWLLTP